MRRPWFKDLADHVCVCNAAWQAKLAPEAVVLVRRDLQSQNLPERGVRDGMGAFWIRLNAEEDRSPQPANAARPVTFLMFDLGLSDGGYVRRGCRCSRACVLVVERGNSMVMRAPPVGRLLAETLPS